ncbi:MAG: spore germination protein [Firmicutes bacterium]|nr:spore germination protein [Bacillota bacterium]
MSWKKTLIKHLIYQKPQSDPDVFKSGLEDRHGGESSQNRAGSAQKSGPLNQNRSKTGDDTEEKNNSSGSGENVTRTGNGTGDAAKDAPRQKRRPARKARGSREKSKSEGQYDAVQAKYADQVEENRDIEELLNTKVKLSYSLEENRRNLARVFHVPQNKDAVLRSLSIGSRPRVKALLVFFDGITNAQVQNLAVLQPLMLLGGLGEDGPPTGGKGDPFKDLFDRVKEAMLPNNQVSVADTYARVVEDVLGGNSALLIDGYNQALLLETKGWHYRSVNTPQVEAVIRGPQEGFTEMLRVNTALVRKIIHHPSLVTEFVKVGEAAPMQCAIMYMVDQANPDLVREVKRRLASIQADFIQETGLLEQMIEDRPFHMVPQVLTTERPDRVASNLLEGKVAVLVEGNPFVMVVPCTFFALMQAPEDAYVRWPFGAFMRLIRYAGLFLALLLPAHYVAIVAYHQEFIPTDLLMVLTGARENVPFPSIVEVLIMEASFELIREAGIRIPGTIGTTLGIVGALILGQAAVAANIVSPILIIVVAVTALGSFAIPNYSFSLSIRLLRFAYIILASLSGLLGIMVGFFIQVGLTSTVKSFGVPFLAPVAPVTKKGHDYYLRGPVWRQESRPDYLDPLKKRRQPKISRRWLRRGNGEGGEERN